MRRLGIAGIIAAVILAALFVPAQPGDVGAIGSHAPAAKKICTIKVKKVRGKKKKVRVCTTVKPNDLLAKQLADAVYQASTPGSRVQALVGVMKALHMGVYTAAGKTVVHGYERSPTDLYLYDFQLTGMAGALERQQMTNLGTVAGMLSLEGTLPDGKPLDVETLRGVLQAGVKSSVARPQDKLSLVPLLVRDLGLHHSPASDMLADVPAAQLQLDALQEFLILSDVLVPIIHQEPPPSARAARAALAATSRGVLRETPKLDFAGPCDLSTNAFNAIQGLWPFGAFGAGLAAKQWLPNVSKALGEAVSKLLAAISIWQATFLAYSIDMRVAGPDQQDTHYGPPDPNVVGSGKPMRFTVAVTMLDDYGENLVSCGKWLGVKLPKKGPVPDVPILWSTSPAPVPALGDLEKHGTITYDPADHSTGKEGTAQFGRASLIFTPKDEKSPYHFGEEYHTANALFGYGLYQSAFGNIPGALGQFLFPKYGLFGYFISWHKPRGFKFDNLQLKVTLTSGVRKNDQPSVYMSTYVFSARICGDDPYAAGWSITVEEHHNWPQDPPGVSFVYDGTATYLFTWQSGETEPPVHAQLAGKISVLLDIGPLPQVQVDEEVADAEKKITTVTTQPVPLEEDTSCPNNPE